LQALDGERVTWTPARDRAAGHALRRGCTVEQCCTALTNAHREHGGLSADGLRCDDGGRLSCDVPHVLHEDRIGAALAGTFSIDWTDPPPFTPRRSPRDNRNTEGTVIR
jgi:hypothetical protein